jgi:hypothetical protein
VAAVDNRENYLPDPGDNRGAEALKGRQRRSAAEKLMRLM